MSKNNYMSLLLILALVIFSSVTSYGEDYKGNLRAGVILTDLEGNNSVHQPSYNLYDGFALSLEKFQYRWDNGLRLNANLINPTLDNRNINFGLLKQGHGGVNFQHNSYRRNYNFDGGEFTRRQTTSGSAWYKPVKQVKIFGGYGVSDKQGQLLQILDYTSELPGDRIDYVNTYYNIGLEFKHKQSYGQFDYNVSDFNNDVVPENDRSTQRLRFTVYTPVPRYNNILVGGGYQFYKNELGNNSDTLRANTVWGVARYTHLKGYEVRYNIIFDRARRTGDLTSTDNIKQVIHAGRSWLGHGGIMLGYAHLINDDLIRARSGNEYSISGWWNALNDLTLRAGFGYINNEVDSGRSLTGDRAYSHHWFSAKYDLENGFVRVKIDNREKENEQLNTSADYVRLTTDFSLSNVNYGDFYASLSYGSGQYENTVGMFDFKEYTLSGDLLTRECKKLQGGIGGSYYKAKEDLDMEISTLRFTGKARIHKRALLEAVYSVHNYDDYNDTARPYKEYYTANVFQISLLWEL